MTLHRKITMLALTVAALTAMPSPAAAGIGAGGCGWTEATRLPGLSTFPDNNTQVYQCLYSAGPLHETVIEGRPPQARFWAFAILDQARREIDSISDQEVALLPDGSYRIRIALDCAEAPNCLETNNGPAPQLPERMFYRTYVPDGPPYGGPLPRVTYQLSAGPDMRVELVDDDAFAGYWAALTGSIATGGAVAELLAQPSGLDQPAPGTAPPPEPERFKGLGTKQLNDLEAAGVPAPVMDQVRQVLGQGGFGATRDNAYVSFPQDMRLGNLVVRAKAPTYRAQSDSPLNDYGRSDGKEQLRYWSLCTTQVTRTVDCVRDENVPLDVDGYWEIVISPVCPVAGYATCLRAGVLSVTGSPLANLVYRNNVAAESFRNDDGPAVCPSPETMFCGEYKPVAHYVAR